MTNSSPWYRWPIDGLPIKNDDFPWHYVSHKQMVVFTTSDNGFSTGDFCTLLKTITETRFRLVETMTRCSYIEDDCGFSSFYMHHAGQVSVGRQDAWNNLSMMASCSALALVVFDLTFHLQYSIQGTLRICPVFLPVHVVSWLA